MVLMVGYIMSFYPVARLLIDYILIYPLHSRLLGKSQWNPSIYIYISCYIIRWNHHFLLLKHPHFRMFRGCSPTTAVDLQSSSTELLTFKAKFLQVRCEPWWPWRNFSATHSKKRQMVYKWWFLHINLNFLDDIVLGMLKVFFNIVYLSWGIASANLGVFWVVRGLFPFIFWGFVWGSCLFGKPVNRIYLDAWISQNITMSLWSNTQALQHWFAHW